MVQTRQHTKRALAEMDERITRFAELEPDWHSYGAKAISPLAITVAREVLRSVIQQIEPTLAERVLAVWIAPLPDGGVVLEWHGTTADLEVTASGTLELLVEERAAGRYAYAEHAHVRVEDVASLLAGMLAA